MTEELVKDEREILTVEMIKIDALTFPCVKCGRKPDIIENIELGTRALMCTALECDNYYLAGEFHHLLPPHSLDILPSWKEVLSKWNAANETLPTAGN
jgi:hypothetical protein